MKMKTTKMILLISALAVSVSVSAQIDLVPGINYSYNPPNAQNIITSITVDACNNDNGNASAFDVSMYLYEQSSGNYWIIGTTRLTSGLSGNACITISNWDIDIDDTPGVPAGTLRLGVWVDSGSEISETDENNNAGLLAGNINYTPSSSGIVSYGASTGFNMSEVYPNPVKEKGIVQFSLLNKGSVRLGVYDITGREVMALEDGLMTEGTFTYEFSTNSLEEGVYFIRLDTGVETRTVKFVLRK